MPNRIQGGRVDKPMVIYWSEEISEKEGRNRNFLLIFTDYLNDKDKMCLLPLLETVGWSKCFVLVAQCERRQGFMEVSHITFNSRCSRISRRIGQGRSIRGGVGLKSKT